MGQVRHGCATTTHAVRAAIQRPQASLATLSRELGINPKTVAKWRNRATVEDLETGPKAPHSTTLSEAEEAMVVAFRRHTLLPLDDCLYALQPTIPHLTRSALHRCLQRWLVVIWAAAPHAARLKWNGVTRSAELFDPAGVAPRLIRSLGTASEASFDIRPGSPRVLLIQQ